MKYLLASLTLVLCLACSTTYAGTWSFKNRCKWNLFSRQVVTTVKTQTVVTNIPTVPAPQPKVVKQPVKKVVKAVKSGCSSCAGGSCGLGFGFFRR